VSNYASTLQQAMFVNYFFIMIFFLMGGMFTPVASMPGWAQVITALNPLKYFIEVMRLVYLKGSTFIDMVPQFLTLCGFVLVFGLCAVVTYRKSS
jgi:ABC-2 type transport system permease protein